MWNRITALMVLVTVSSLSLNPIEVEARDGGRGVGGGGGGRSGSGGARGGGGYRGGNTMNRTPTMSRVSSRPSTAQANRPSYRPSASQGRVQQARQNVQQRPSTANRSDIRNQVNQYAQSAQRPAQTLDRQALAQRTQNFSSQHSKQLTQNRQFSDAVSQRLQEARPDSNQWFDGNFFDRHNIDVDYGGIGIGDNLWRPAAWGALATWGAWNWETPYYYDDEGNAYPITITEPTDAYPYTPMDIYTQPAQTQPAETDQTTASNGNDWLPLGVFAVAGNTQDATQSDRFIQLAINRSGDISGVLYNAATDTAQEVTGMVGTRSQKAYFSLSNRPDSPIASTGIYNLTEDTTPINVHFSDGSDQTWNLVRLKQ